MTLRVLFGVMSALQSQETVTQLVDVLRQYPVVIHHDFTKRSDFTIVRPNVSFVPAPAATGWGSWGFAQGILRLLHHCLEHFEFDYFQLLSPTCLPLRPLDEYLTHLNQERADIYADIIDILATEENLMTFGYRTFSPRASLRHMLLRRARNWYFGSEATLIQTHSLSMLHRERSNNHKGGALMKFSGLALTRLAARGWLGLHPYSDLLRPMVGSTWFCASRPACKHLLKDASDPKITTFFSRLINIDETMFPTLLANSGFRVSHSNHAVSNFTIEGHPQWITDADLEALFSTGRYFGRKFPDDPMAPVRQQALQRAEAIYS